MGTWAGLQVVKMGPQLPGEGVVSLHLGCFGDLGGASSHQAFRSLGWSQGGPGLESWGLQLRLAVTCLTLYPSSQPHFLFFRPKLSPSQ